MNITYQTKTVSLAAWEKGLYEGQGWQVRGYSEFGYDGVPRYVELEREVQIDTETNTGN